jgi:long-chain acyl-CoA synthetase
VGLPIQGVEIAAFRDDGTPAGVNETGEIAVKSPAAIAGYGSPVSGPQPFRDGYFLTGDVGRIDTHGYLYLVGRKTFFINKAGYKINPFEIETLLEEHPKVKEAVVIGVPTPYGEESVKAVIVPQGPCSEEEIAEFCRGRIANFKVPSLIEFCPKLPKSPTGKILRKQLH